jgi:hypothetical protein
MDEYLTTNRDHWEELADIHPSTDFYAVEDFLNGETTLSRLEREELGEVSKQLCSISSVTSDSTRYRGHAKERW